MRCRRILSRKQHNEEQRYQGTRQKIGVSNMKIKFPKDGKFGEFGGKYIPETLFPAVQELEESYLKYKNDKEFKKELDYYLREYAGRPTWRRYCDGLCMSWIKIRSIHGLQRYTKTKAKRV